MKHGMEPKHPSCQDRGRRELASSLLVKLTSVVAVEDAQQVLFLDREEWIQHRITTRGWTLKRATNDWAKADGVLSHVPRRGALGGMALPPSSTSLTWREHSAQLSAEVAVMPAADEHVGLEQVREHTYSMNSAAGPFADMGVGA